MLLAINLKFKLRCDFNEASKRKYFIWNSIFFSNRKYFSIMLIADWPRVWMRASYPITAKRDVRKRRGASSQVCGLGASLRARGIRAMRREDCTQPAVAAHLPVPRRTRTRSSRLRRRWVYLREIFHILLKINFVWIKKKKFFFSNEVAAMENI